MICDVESLSLHGDNNFRLFLNNNEICSTTLFYHKSIDGIRINDK